MQILNNQKTGMSSDPQNWTGLKQGCFIYQGKHRNETCLLQFSPDGGTTWVDVLCGSGRDCVQNFSLPAGKIRLQLSGGQAGLNVNAWVIEHP